MLMLPQYREPHGKILNMTYFDVRSEKLDFSWKVWSANDFHIFRIEKSPLCLDCLNFLYTPAGYLSICHSPVGLLSKGV